MIRNGMRGLLINDFTASKSLLEIAMNNGSFIDTDSEFPILENI